MRLGAFLARAKSGVFSHVVLGNEAADMDSVVSSLVYSFLLTQKTGELHVPVVNVPAADLCLRTDVTRLFSLTSVDASSLLFSDQVNLADKRLHLVDHNRLSAAQGALAGQVVEVLDHHRDDGLYRDASPRRIVFPLGSCCTLVAQHALLHQAALVDRTVATLLLGPILVDTGNLDPELGKTEPLDAEMAAALAPLAGLGDRAARDGFFAGLNNAKFDVSQLSIGDLLRKDYKEFIVGSRRVGMCAVLRELSDMPAEELQRAADEWMARQKLDVLVVMTAYFEGPDKRFARQNWFVGGDERLADSVAAHLEGEASLKLQRLRLGAAVRGRAFTQGDVRPSRKQIAPLVIDWIEKTESKL